MTRSIVILAAALAGMGAGTVLAEDWVTAPIGGNAGFPQIHGPLVVWAGWDGSDGEIYVYNGTTTTQLTDNGYRDLTPQVHGSNIVWLRDYRTDMADSDLYEIFLHDGSQTIRLTENTTRDWKPRVHGSWVVWEGHDGNDDEIFLYDGTTVIQLTDNDYGDWDPQTDGEHVVWQGAVDNEDGEIFLYDGTSITQLTDNDDDESSPQVDGSYVVWELQRTLQNHEIYVHDGTTTTRLTRDVKHDRTPQVHRGKVVWSKVDGDEEIFLWDGADTIQLTNNSHRDRNPQIYGSNVVWEQWDGTRYKIVVHDGQTTTTLVSDESPNEGPQVHGSTVVWMGGPGVLMARSTEPHPDIWANGSDDPAVVPVAGNLDVSVGLDPGTHEGTPADFWIVARTPFGDYSFEPVSGLWIPGLAPAYQGPMRTTAELAVYAGAPPPAGTYTLLFAVDRVVDAVLTPAQGYFDWIRVDVVD